MLTPSPRNIARRNVFIILGVLVFLFFAFFWRDIFGLPAPKGAEDSVINPLQMTLVCLTSYFLVFFLWVILISFQALLPITNFLDDPLQCLLEVYRTSFYLMLHMLGLHGPAVFVRDGFDNRTNEDNSRENWPGVVVVDFNSAVVLEERNPPPGLGGAFINILTLLGQMLLLVDRRESPRVRGAGIVFTRPRERIRGTVDLRKQFRFRAGVSGYTREGIEVTSRTIAIFAVGQEPEVLNVTYVGERLPENLRIVTIDPAPQSHGRVRIAAISNLQDELEAADRAEIHANYLNRMNPRVQNDLGDWSPNLQLSSPFTFLRPPTDQPVFNERRVFSAVFAQATSSQAVLDWTELPGHVAAGFFREIISHINYDELYDVRGSGDFPLPNFRARLRRAMRNNGVLSYRLVMTTYGDDLVAGHVYPANLLQATDPISLRSTKVLRDRGIRVIMSSFGDPIPVNGAIYQQRLDAWRASWEQEMDLTMADQDRTAMRERGRAHAETQQEIYYALSRLFSQYDHADEALTLRILQALETAAADPKTRALLPEHTLGLMRHVSMLLLPPAEQVPPSPPR